MTRATRYCRADRRAEKRRKSLGALVTEYKRNFAPRLCKDLCFFKNLATLRTCIDRAARAIGEDKKIHRHQHRVGRKILVTASTTLLPHADEIGRCTTFEELLMLIRRLTQHVDRFGDLAVYDTSLRIGAHLTLWPRVVHLHAGTKIGCRALGFKTAEPAVKMEDLPAALGALEPFQVEDFLCIFKDEFPKARVDV